MDPIAIEARTKYKQPKPRQTFEKLTSFQRALHANPYAHALATPLRLCASTSALLPKHFLIPFETQVAPPAQEPDEHTRPPQDGTSKSPLQSRASKLQLVPTLPNNAPGTCRKGPTSFLISRQSALAFASKKKGWHSLVSLRMQDKARTTRRESWSWRENMVDHVLAGMRNSVVANLHWPFQHANAKLLLDVEDELDCIDKIDDVSCVLYLRPVTQPRIVELANEISAMESRIHTLASRVAEVRRQALQSLERLHNDQSRPPQIYQLEMQPALLHPPLYFPTVQYRGTEIPVYELVEMLGEENVGALVRGTKWEGAVCVIVQRTYLTTGVQLALSGLQGFIAEGRTVVT
ncbi:hypothetical protein LTR66_005369 [Elasticomyces elasticus]|nr:hypothetical protein LTR50_002243 [Elasticomyces elasticus]KAK4994640.1 hypothetical protein LTR66_005369 [Elasticomyces elasticus]